MPYFYLVLMALLLRMGLTITITGVVLTSQGGVATVPGHSALCGCHNPTGHQSLPHPNPWACSQ